MCKPAYVESPLALTENTCRISVSSLSLKEMKCLSWVVVSPARNFKSALSCSFVHLSIYTLSELPWRTILDSFMPGHMTELYQLELLDCYKKGFMVVSVLHAKSFFSFCEQNSDQPHQARSQMPGFSSVWASRIHISHLCSRMRTMTEFVHFVLGTSIMLLGQICPASPLPLLQSWCRCLSVVPTFGKGGSQELKAVYVLYSCRSLFCCCHRY